MTGRGPFRSSGVSRIPQESDIAHTDAGDFGIGIDLAFDRLCELSPHLFEIDEIAIQSANEEEQNVRCDVR